MARNHPFSWVATIIIFIVFVIIFIIAAPIAIALDIKDRFIEWKLDRPLVKSLKKQKKLLKRADELHKSSQKFLDNLDKQER